MADDHVMLHCEPCEDCVSEVVQRVTGGRLRWDSSSSCSRYVFQACRGGWGVPPQDVRGLIIADEGTVALPVGGAHGIPLRLLRELYGLSVAEVAAARATGWAATPVEAAYLRSAAAAVGRGEDTDEFSGARPSASS
ncbi:hypothetical protein AMK16_24980 [Streptomyces sp. CB00455]|uniref:hypothetical protein n=1 Tax=Streptomyces sp. CB00455 TaxID=1703927 RepID=UPI00096453DA|nr:hypothetical protein [Streptomyces sp. CB00455]OKK16000.1 hypothetical protein AMK16_24980 [Streptomyces sp. CB00455]